MTEKELLDLIEKFLRNEYDAEDFSFDFPGYMLFSYDNGLLKDNDLRSAFNEMSVICSWFDPYDTGESDTLGEEEFKAKIRKEYDTIMQKAGWQKKAI